jgi:hypothetical protein
VSTSALPFGPTRTVAASVDIQPNAMADGSAKRLIPMPTSRPFSVIGTPEIL